MAQVDPGFGEFGVLELVDEFGARLGIVVVVGEPGRGYEKNHEYWRFDEAALIDIGSRNSIEISVWFEGSWDDPQAREALSWYPSGRGVEWVHPTNVEWTSFESEEPPATGEGTYFGHVDVGGLTFDYSTEGDSALTWFKLTEGDFMQLEDGVLMQRTDPPTTGSWWAGAID